MSGVQQLRRERHALIWHCAVGMGEFTYQSLAQSAEISVSSVQVHVKAWLQQGAVTRHQNGNDRALLFRVVERDAAPASLRPDGRARREETIQGNCWRVMRRLANFSPTDIAAHANTQACNVSVADAQTYCQLLSRAGYLKVVRKALPGRREAVYRLIKNTGPMPPRERRVRAVFDDNLCEFTHLAGAQ